MSLRGCRWTWRRRISYVRHIFECLLPARKNCVLLAEIQHVAQYQKGAIVDVMHAVDEKFLRSEKSSGKARRLDGAVVYRAEMYLHTLFFDAAYCFVRKLV